MKKKVLIIDDSEEFRSLLAQYLGGKGYLVEAADPVDCLEKTRAYRPDIVLLDVMMPGRSGIEVLRGLQADECAKNIPVLVVTGRHFDREIGTFFLQEPNCRDFMPKSADLGLLAGRIAEILS